LISYGVERVSEVIAVPGLDPGIDPAIHPLAKKMDPRVTNKGPTDVIGRQL
jgi:hypothetical protein